MLTDGQPSRFHGKVTGQAAMIARSVAVELSPSKACACGGGWAVVGASTTSTDSKMLPTRRAVRVSLARARRSMVVDSSRPMRMLDRVRGSHRISPPSRSAHSSSPGVDRLRKSMVSRIP